MITKTVLPSFNITLNERQSYFILGDLVKIKLKKVYSVYKGKNLRAKIQLETQNSLQTFIIAVNSKTQSVISTTWGGITVYYLDLDQQTVGLTINFKHVTRM